MATVTIFSPQGVRTITFEGDSDPTVTPVEAGRVLQKIGNPDTCDSCTFLFDASNGRQKLTFEALQGLAASLKKQPAVRLQEGVPQREAPKPPPPSLKPGEGSGEVPTLRYPVGELLASGVVIQHPTGATGGRWPKGNTVVVYQDGRIVAQEPLVIDKSWVRVFPQGHRFGGAGNYEVRIYGPGETVDTAKIGGQPFARIVVGTTPSPVAPQDTVTKTPPPPARGTDSPRSTPFVPLPLPDPGGTGAMPEGGSVEVTQGLSAGVINDFIRARHQELNRVYSGLLKYDPGLKGKLEVSIVIRPDGTIESVRIDSVPGLGELAKGIREKILRWRLPSSDNPTSYKFPLIFTTGT